MWCYTHGIDPLEVPPHRLWGLVYGWAVSRIQKETDLYEFNSWLDEPPPLPPDVDPDDYNEGVWSGDAEMAAFNQLSGSG